MSKTTSQTEPVFSRDRTIPILAAAGVVAILVSTLFLYTYPINIGQSDNLTYLDMVITGRSDLMQASGYPAVVHFLAQVLPILPSVTQPIHSPVDISPGWFKKLQTIQFGLHFVLFSGSVLLCSTLFGRPVAAIFALAWGCNLLFVGNVDATAPEWLQADVLLLALLLHAWASRLAGTKRATVYCLGAGAFSLAYLIKPNSLLFSVALIPLILLVKGRLRIKAIQFLASCAIFALLVAAYANLYHFRSTGTTKLNFDHAWVLTANLPEDYLSASLDRLGINSLRYAVLVRTIPADYSKAGMVPNINFGPPSPLKEQLAGELGRVYSMSRPELLQFAKDHPLPSGYSQWSSVVPMYFGLEPTDELGEAVFIESLQSHFWFHLRQVASALEIFFTRGLKGIATFPTFADSMGYRFLPPDFTKGALGSSRIVPPAAPSGPFMRSDGSGSPYALQYYNPQETVGFYGVKILGLLNRVNSVPLIYLVLDIVAVLGFSKLERKLDRLIVLSVAASLFAFICASGILNGLRQKELITLTPLYLLIISIGCLSALRSILPDFLALGPREEAGVFAVEPQGSGNVLEWNLKKEGKGKN